MCVALAPRTRNSTNTSCCLKYNFSTDLIFVSANEEIFLRRRTTSELTTTTLGKTLDDGFSSPSERKRLCMFSHDGTFYIFYHLYQLASSRWNVARVSFQCWMFPREGKAISMKRWTSIYECKLAELSHLLLHLFRLLEKSLPAEDLIKLLLVRTAKAFEYYFSSSSRFRPDDICCACASHRARRQRILFGINTGKTIFLFSNVVALKARD